MLTGPFSGVKEQVTGNYARRLAEAGFVALAFDHRNLGESEGEPRQHEDPQGRLHDLRDAVSFLGTRPEVREGAIGAVGVCFGAGFALRVAAFDRRIRAVALIAGGYATPAKRRQRFGAERFEQMLAEFSAIAQRQFETGQVEYQPAVAEDGPAAMPGAEPFAYYGTSRSASPHWVNRLTRLSLFELFTNDNASAARFISPTPMLVVHGRTDHYCLPEDAQDVFDAAGEPKRIVWLDTTSHIDLYDQDQYVTPAVAAAAEWLGEHLDGDRAARGSGPASSASVAGTGMGA